MDHFYELARRLGDLYVSTKRKYVTMWPGGGYSTIQKKLEPWLLATHLNQKFTIGVFASDTAGSPFVCFDVDYDDLEIVKKVIHGLVAYGFPEDYIYVSGSGNKGYHVEMFFSGTVFTNLLWNMYKWVIATEGLDPDKVEFRPNERQAIKLPLGKHQRTGNTCWFIDKSTWTPITGEAGYDFLFEIRQLDRGWVEELCKKTKRFAPDIEEPEAPRAEYVDVSSLDDGIMPPLKERGTRHVVMLHIALWLHSRGRTEDQVFSELMNWYERQDQSLISSSRADVEADALGLARWVESITVYKNYERRPPFIFQSDLDLCIAQPTQSRRKIVLLVAAFTRRFRMMRMSGVRLGEFIGCSKNYSLCAMRELCQDRIVEVVGGKVKHGEQGFIRTSNEYVLVDERAKDGRLKNDFGKRIPLEWDFHAESFDGAYTAIIANNVPEDVWSKRLTPQERREIQFYIKKRNQEEHSIE